MELGVFTKVYEPLALRRTLRAAERDGFTCVHLNMETLALSKSFQTIPRELAARVRRVFGGSGARPVTLSATYNLIHPDAAVRRQGVRRVLALVELAAEADIPAVTICTGTRDPRDMWRGHPDNASAEARRDLANSLEALLPTCESKRVKLELEIEPSNVVSTAQSARALLDAMRSRALGVVMDGCNLMVGHRPSEASAILAPAFELLADEIDLAHAKDYEAASGAMLPAGRGDMDYSVYLRLLLQLPKPVPLLLHGLGRGEAPLARDFILEQWSSRP